jgi:putative membrane protein
LRRLLLRWVINAVAAYAAMRLVTGFHVAGGWTVYLWLALILGLANALIAPLVKFLTCPLILATLGLFTLVINAVMLLVAARVSQFFGLAVSLDSFWAAILAALVISLVSTVLSSLMGVNRSDRRREERR